MAEEPVSGLRTPYVDLALRFFGIERRQASDKERCEDLCEALASRGYDLPTFLSVAGASASMGVPPPPPTTPRPDECEELSFNGYRDLQRLQPPAAFDTISDLDVPSISSVEGLYEAVIGKAMRQQTVVGIVHTGPITLGGMTSQAWNERVEGIHFGSGSTHDEIWQVRSHPPGRIGQKLRPGEMRKVTVLLRNAQRHGTNARLTTMRLWLLPPDTAAERPEVRRGQSTYASIGVNMAAIHLWEHHGREFLATHDLPEGVRGFHAVYAGYRLLTHTAPDGPNEGIAIPCAMASDYVHQIVLASSLAAIAVPDRPTHRLGFERVCQRAWSHRKHSQNVGFCEAVAAKNPDAGNPTILAARLLFGADGIADQASLLGLLDMLADPFYEHGLPNDMRQPNGLMLMMAVAVRIACDPERVGVPMSTPDDRWAERGVCQLLEAAYPCVLPMAVHDEEHMRLRGTNMFGVDLLLEQAIQTLSSDLDVHETENSVPKETVDFVRKTIQNSLETLHCMGTAICMDVCGVTPKQRDGTSGVYTEFGFARSCCDPVQEARNQAAYEVGLGDLAPWYVPPRSSTKNARQRALVRIFGCVERWLLDGTHDGIVLPPRVNRTLPETDNLAELCVRRTHDEFGKVTSVSIRREAQPPALAAMAEAIRTGKLEVGSEPVAESDGRAARGASGASLGNKKKQRAAAKRGAKLMSSASKSGQGGGGGKRQDDAELDRIALETLKRTKGAALTEAEALDQVTTTLSARQRERGRVLREKLRKEALMESSTLEGSLLLSNVFQQGVGRGVTEAFDVQTFLVGKGSAIRCAHCPRFVNVVQGLAFAGRLGSCRNCNHPRCLHCVDEDLDAIDRNAESGADAACVYGRDLFGCLFCASQ